MSEIQTNHPPQPQSEPLLSLRDVSLAYWLKGPNPFKHRQFWALKNISFDLQRGESIGIIGRNGAGKSTLLRLLAGIVEPDGGRIVFKEGVTASLLSLSLGLLPYLTGRENAIQGALFQGLDLTEFKRHLEEIRQFSGLGDFFDQPIYSYSSGMHARLAFSIAIQINPTILLVDELLGVGDIEFKEKAVNVMKGRIRDDAQTVVFVSHNMPTVRQLCTRVLWIENGELIEEGECKQVVDSFVAHRRSADSIKFVD